MWFNDWVEVKKGQDENHQPYLFLYLSFRNGADILGPIRCPYPGLIPSGRFLINNGVLSAQEQAVYHTYPTRVLSRPQVESISAKVLSACGPGHVGLQDAGGGVVQLRNISHASFVSLDDAVRQYFIPGHYAEQARWQFGWPLRKVSIDPVLEEVVPAFSELSQLYRELWKVRLQKRKSLPEFREAQEKRNALCRIIGQLHPGNAVGVNEKSGELHLALASLAGIRLLDEQLSECELMNLPWCFIDTEKKFFAYPEAKNCHVTLVFSGKDSGVVGEVHTTEYAGVHALPANVNGTGVVFSVTYYKTDVEMVQGAVASIRRQNPAVLCGHNIPYDAGEMRETREHASKPGFPIGLESTDPRTAVSMEFFRRIDCRGKMVMDTWKLARILDSYLPSFGLETVAGIKKSITYQMFDKLARSADVRDKLAQAAYASHDVLALYHHIFHGPWKGRLGCVVDAARAFGVSVSESGYLPSCAEKIRDRIFFIQNGTYRNARDRKAVMVKMRKRFQKKWPSIRDNMLNPLFSVVPSGRYENVHRVYLPLEQALYPVTSIFFDQVDQLMEGFYQRPAKDQVAVCQYLKGMQAEQWLHWFYIKLHEGDAFSAQRDFIRPSEGGSGSLLDCMKIPRANFDALRREFWDQYEANKHSKNHAQNLALMRQAFGDGVLLSDAGRVCDKTLHAMVASRRFLDRHFFSVDRWDNIAVRYASLVMDAIAGSGATLIGRKGQWIYLLGPLPPPSRSAPIIPVDVVTLLKFTHKGDVRIVFKENGGYHGIDLDQKRPSSRTIHESRSIAAIIDQLLEGNQEMAGEVFKRKYQLLRDGGVERSDLLFSVEKDKSQFLGIDEKKGHVICSYAERDQGLPGFIPMMDFYLQRFEREVGRWCEVLKTGRLKTIA